ncbi:Wzz/FepE/Etk N-terminal domain-containing protein [Acidithiobacillus ferrivorans]|uniref:Wzz/FepE/Etk N-terminal domain-containing protein n=1 Tax=Acidithiobacillus ferrivorans TaxID=160808 RepID=UPI001C078848|nr:Wzz/FepE/Etk N-terminal domain-containing protein [Acidithiobacillus ferrivorans]MBU2851340.1 chain-length determining protein [Acidithiobacillus ferrivorans]
MSLEEKVPQDEFGLRDVWEIVLGRKWLIIATTAICVGLALAYVTLATTIYESRAMVQIGKVAGQPLDNAPQLASRLMNHYTLVNTELAQKQLPKLYAVTPDKEDGIILTLKARARSPQEAQQYLQGIIQRLLANQQQRYDQLFKARQAQLGQMQAEYEDLRPPLNAKKRMGKAQTDSASALLLLEQSRRTETLSTMLVAIANMENELAPVNTMPTIETLSPRYDPNPVAPKRLLILVLAMVGGLMLGVFLALVQNGSRRQADRVASS